MPLADLIAIVRKVYSGMDMNVYQRTNVDVTEMNTIDSIAQEKHMTSIVTDCKYAVLKQYSRLGADSNLLLYSY